VVSNDGTLSELDKKELADLLMNMPIMWPDNNSNDKFQLPIEQKKLGILSKTGKKFILYLVYQIEYTYIIYGTINVCRSMPILNKTYYF